MNQPIILLNGWPGVGKDTVAETLKLLLGDDKADLVDWSKGQTENFQPLPEDDDTVAHKVQRDACFQGQVEHPNKLSKIIICTDCLPDTPEGRRMAQQFEIVANRCHRLLIPVYLDCQLDENMRRIENAERRVSLKDKSRSFLESNDSHSQSNAGSNALSMDCRRFAHGQGSRCIHSMDRPQPGSRHQVVSSATFPPPSPPLLVISVVSTDWLM